ncbi:hypothetical protein [Legionella rowbothamii]|uniref:hypothetical protein n=1 Tax=Legionella rowbothamii TaxID=96229 RepID=UPI0013EF8F60|nr:hypothetical protein [Legionella rowbothamii]
MSLITTILTVWPPYTQIPPIHTKNTGSSPRLFATTEAIEFPMIEEKAEAAIL